MEYQYKDAETYLAGVLDKWTPKALALYLRVNNTHIYRARVGDITLTLRRAIAARGFAPPPPPRHRHRRAADLHTAERAAQFDAMISERDTSLTEWMNKELDRWLTR